MKRIWMLFVFAFMPFILVAQDKEEDEMQTIFDFEKPHTISGFGGPAMTFSSFDNEFAYMMGGQGAAIINRKLYFGGFGMGLTSNHLFDETDDESKISFGYGGIMLGYVFSPKKPIHPSAGVRFGGGNINMDDFNQGYTYNEDVYVIEPHVGVEFNITRFFKFDIGATYRAVFGANDMPGFNYNDFSSPAAYVRFNFGWF